MSDSMPPDPSGTYPPAGQQQPGVPPQQPNQRQPGVPPQQPNQQAPSGGGKPLLFGGIGVVVGLLVGVLAGSTLLGGSGSGGGDAAEDAAIACDYASSLAEDFDPDALALDDPLIWQLQAAGGLAQAAATADPAYAMLGEQGLDLFEGASRLDTELLEETLQAMDTTCASAV